MNYIIYNQNVTDAHQLLRYNSFKERDFSQLSKKDLFNRTRTRDYIYI